MRNATIFHAYVQAYQNCTEQGLASLWKGAKFAGECETASCAEHGAAGCSVGCNDQVAWGVPLTH